MTSRPPENGDRVTNRQLYEALENLPSRLELRLTVAVTLLGGQVLASGITAWLTGVSPPAQVSAVAGFAYHVFF